MPCWGPEYLPDPEYFIETLSASLISYFVLLNKKSVISSTIILEQNNLDIYFKFHSCYFLVL